MVKFTSSSVYDINKSAPFGNICPSLTIILLKLSCKSCFFLVDVELHVPGQSEPLMQKGIHRNIFLF